MNYIWLNIIIAYAICYRGHIFIYLSGIKFPQVKFCIRIIFNIITQANIITYFIWNSINCDSYVRFKTSLNCIFNINTTTTTVTNSCCYNKFSFYFKSIAYCIVIACSSYRINRLRPTVKIPYYTCYKIITNTKIDIWYKV